MEPIVKWAGGKRTLIKEILEFVDIRTLIGSNGRYYEPFVGGGALAFNLELTGTIINDSNTDLINLYNVIKSSPNELIKLLKIHQENYSASYYNQIREMDKYDNYKDLPAVEKAARFVFLNKTCYNGLYRVNLKGFFNVPFGKYKNPDIINEKKIFDLHKLFNEKSFEIRNVDFEDAVFDAKKGDIIYFDPPYDYEDKGFTSYSAKGFSKKDLIRLKNLCDNLIKKGCKVIISNNDTKFVNELFDSSEYDFKPVKAFRFINCNGKKRKNAKEVIIYGKEK